MFPLKGGEGGRGQHWVTLPNPTWVPMTTHTRLASLRGAVQIPPPPPPFLAGVRREGGEVNLTVGSIVSSYLEEAHIVSPSQPQEVLFDKKKQV